jgi:Ras-related and estrogen-regulated growth inhibitor-like protein
MIIIKITFFFFCFVVQTTCLYDHIRWADAFVIVYSVVDLSSFNEAQYLLDELSKHKLPSYFATLLLGNKRDLDHSR